MIPQISSITSGCNSIDLFDPLKLPPSPNINVPLNAEEIKIKKSVLSSSSSYPLQCNTRKEK